MRVSEQWLRDWCDPPIGVDELAASLTSLGLEVDTVLPVAPGFDGVIVARVESVEPHPDADRLRVCRVEAGLDAPLSIVCGAPNVRPGLVTALATIGGRLPDGTKLKQAKLRGVPSEGMLCSAVELGLSEHGEGIMELAADAPVGLPLGEYLALDDSIIVVELTPDRGDCLSIRGLARDLAAKHRMSLALPANAKASVQSSQTHPVEVEPGTACVRFTGRVIQGLDLARPSPGWMTERLRRAGLRSINPAVDVTNYVMLERGTPMHAFDLAKLAGPIRVRHAESEEKLLLLDGREVTLAPDTTVIADDSGAIGIAGIMGGDSTAVSPASDSIFFECALFLPEYVSGRPRRYASLSDSSHRFERGVDPSAQIDSLEYATALLIDIAGGKAGPTSDWRDEARLPSRRPVVLRRARLARIIGTVLPDDEITGSLERLGIRVEPLADGWRVTPPSWRYDLSIEEDFIEEVARLFGFDRLPRTMPMHRPGFRGQPETLVTPLEIKRLLAQRGYQEIATYAFVDKARQSALRPDLESLPLANPISSDLSVMRTTLLTGLVETAIRNQNRQIGSMRLFESGLRFLPASGDDFVDAAIDPLLGEDLQLDASLRQQSMVAGLLTGRRWPENWNGGDEPVDFFDAKADLEALFARSSAASPRFERSDLDFLCPGRRADIIVGGRRVGYVGALTPALERTLGLTSMTIVFEVASAALAHARLPSAVPVSRFPSMRRDLALVVDAGVEHDALVATVHAHAPDSLTEVLAFDVYAGPGIEIGRKSVALGLILQNVSRTLADSEVDAAVARIVAALAEAHGAVLRG